MAVTSRLKIDGSILGGLTVVGLVIADYNIQAGSVSVAHATPANDGNLQAARKKAGYSAFVLVAGISLVSKDVNIAILGGGTIIAMELSYRHAILTNPETGQIVPPAPQAYQPAQNVVPINSQGADVSYG
jgi:hypothetical protein